jgi:hypothetical protein
MITTLATIMLCLVLMIVVFASFIAFMFGDMEQTTKKMRDEIQIERIKKESKNEVSNK